MYLKYILHLKCWRSNISYLSKFFFIKINLYFQWNKRKCHWNPLWKYRNTYMYQCFLKYPNILRYENLTQYRSILFYTWLCVLAIHLLLKYYNGIHRIKLVIFSFLIIYIDVQPYIIDNSMSSWNIHGLFSWIHTKFCWFYFLINCFIRNLKSNRKNSCFLIFWFFFL